MELRIQQIQKGGRRAATVANWYIVPQTSAALLLWVQITLINNVYSVMDQDCTRYDSQRSSAFCRVPGC